MAIGDVGVGSSGRVGPAVRAVRLDDPWYGPPREVTAVPLDPLLDELPFLQMDPYDFEKLLWKLVIEVEGLRDVHRFGTYGQKDDGLDVVGRTAGGAWHGWQGKRYEAYGPADLVRAVEDHTVRGSGEFPVERLVVCVPCKIKRQVTAKLRELKKANPGLELELLGPDHLGSRLRRRSDIVTEFFGAQTAQRFCLPGPAPVVIAAPSVDRADLADAARRSPAAVFGAAPFLESAARCFESQDYRAAADNLWQAEQRLGRAGFEGHAASVAHRRTEALIKAGSLDEASVLLSDAFWLSADTGDTDGAADITHRLGQALRIESDETDDVVPPGTERASRLLAVMEAARELLLHPFPEPEIPDLLLGDPAGAEAEFTRLAALAGETALMDRDVRWVVDHADRLSVLAQAPREHDVWSSTRLNLVIADATGRWEDVLGAARRREYPRLMCALVLARYARHLAVANGDPLAADHWKEAVEQACLDGYNGDAGEWVNAQRLLHHWAAPRQLPDFDDFELARSLRLRPGKAKLFGETDLLGQGLGDLHDGKLRSAVIALRQQVRISTVTGRWFDEHVARRRLAEALRESGEFDRAAAQVVAVGETAAAKELAEAAGEYFVDVTGSIGTGPYWERATALRLLAEQADLLPDPLVDPVAEAALAIVAPAQEDLVAQIRSQSPSVHEAACNLLAALSGRLDGQRAAQLLDIFRPLAPRKENSGFRLTDDTHAKVLTSVAQAHTSLRDDALDQAEAMLVGDRALPGALRDIATVMAKYGRGRITRLAEIADAGSDTATEILGYFTRDAPDELLIGRAKEALARITAPRPAAGGNGSSLGTAAGPDASLIRLLPEADRLAAVHALIAAAQGPDPLMNRAEFIDAAALLIRSLSRDTAVGDLFPRVLAAAEKNSEPNEADLSITATDHALSWFRINLPPTDLEAHWLYLAAALARTRAETDRVRDRILVELPGAGSDGGYFLVRSLQLLSQETLAPHVLLLAAHPHWAARSLSAVLWARHDDVPLLLGTVLARDPDARVRRTLAGVVAGPPQDRTAAAREVLAADPRCSVRAALDSVEGSTA
ncbi:hypothetical protein [Kitasatospora phosalacinea]|uniref:Uncharacterized protein n=1 Tax=Kitasatospora phosalacinea TaxID=2065 RepID=A0ABW6GLK1_9ACTN